MENGVSYYDFPMKWHKFLIYFALWAGAVMNGFNGIAQMTGRLYDSSAASVYAIFPMMQPVDIICGAVSLAYAVFQLVTRFALAQLKTRGPKMVVALYACGPIPGLAYIISVWVICDIGIGNLLDTSTIFSLVMPMIFAAATHAYYKRRAAVFVN